MKIVEAYELARKLDARTNYVKWLRAQHNLSRIVTTQLEVAKYSENIDWRGVIDHLIDGARSRLYTPKTLWIHNEMISILFQDVDMPAYLYDIQILNDYPFVIALETSLGPTFMYDPIEREFYSCDRLWAIVEQSLF